jgi:hypothetical protein
MRESAASSPAASYSDLMNIRWGGSVWELMLVKHSVGTVLSNSASGGKSTLLRGATRNLVGHADLRNATPVVVGLVAASGVLTVATMKATSHLKTKLRPAAQDTAAQAAEATSDTPVEESEAPQGPRLRAV